MTTGKAFDGKPYKQLIMSVAVAAVAMGTMAEITNTVKVTKFHQSYPYSGRATVEYTIGGTLPANAVAEITLSADGVRATFTQRGVVAGANRNVVETSPRPSAVRCCSPMPRSW